MHSDEKTQLFTRIEPDLAEKLQRLADEADRSLSAELRRAIRAYIDERETKAAA